MAKTFVKKPIGIVAPQHTVLSYAAFDLPEGASQTWTAGTPVVFSSGLIVAATDPVDDTNVCFGIAIEDAENVASGGRSKVVPLADNVYVYANLMTGDGADHVFAAANLGAVCAMSSKSGFVSSGVTDWFLDIADTGGGGFFIASDRGDLVTPNVDNGELAEVGDTNVRVACILTPASRQVI